MNANGKCTVYAARHSPVGSIRESVSGEIQSAALRAPHLRDELVELCFGGGVLCLCGLNIVRYVSSAMRLRLGCAGRLSWGFATEGGRGGEGMRGQRAGGGGGWGNEGRGR
jgi:hypothetical protein